MRYHGERISFAERLSMNLLKPLVPLLLLTQLAYAQNSQNRGTSPMPAATGYSAHAEQEGAQIGATLLTHKQARKAFATADLNRCCLVVEVALYPAKDNFIKISAADFTLREAGKDIGMKPSSAEVLAAALEVRPPEPEREQKAGVSTSSTVGVDGGRSRDPYTGTTSTTRGVYERQSVGVGVPIGGKQQSPEAKAEQSRMAIGNELTEKGLSEISAWEPIAGYLYFSVPKKSKDGYELVYTLGEKKIVLQLK
jgi:hypothetical protein